MWRIEGALWTLPSVLPNIYILLARLSIMATMRRRQVLSLTSAAAVVLAGCTTARERVGDVLRSPPERRVDPDWRPEPGTWAEQEYGPQKRRYNPHATPPRTEPTIDWERHLDEPLIDGCLIVAEDTVYLTTRHRLWALDASDGTIRWKQAIDGPAGLKYVDGRIYQLRWRLRESELVARSPGGDEQWRTTVPQYGRGVHEQNGYVFVAGRNRYWTLHADTGEIVRERDDWVRNLASADGSVYAAFSGILVRYEVDGSTLEERWRVKSSYPTESDHPLIMEDRVYELQYQPTTDAGGVAVYSTGGERRDRIELDFRPFRLTGTEHGLVVSPNTRSDGPLLGIPSDGSERWTADVSGYASAIAANGTVYAGSPLVALDAESGGRLWEQNSIRPVQLAAADSTLYAVSGGSRIVAFRD